MFRKNVPAVSKKYTKLIKCNLKLIMLINTVLLILDSTQFSLNFEPSFVGIYQVLTEIWLFQHEFYTRNFGHSGLEPSSGQHQ